METPKPNDCCHAYLAYIKHNEVHEEMAKLSLSPKDIAKRLKMLYCAQEKLDEASEQQPGHTGDETVLSDLP